MAYDDALAERIRELLIHEPDVIERKMFGRLAFLVGGHLAVAASNQGGALVRVDPAASEALVARAGARVAVMRGRPMEGWLRVESAHLRTRRALETWVRRGADYARSLPPKQPKSTSR